MFRRREGPSDPVLAIKSGGGEMLGTNHSSCAEGSQKGSCAGHCSSTLSVGRITALKETKEGIFKALVLLGRASGILILGFSGLVWER